MDNQDKIFNKIKSAAQKAEQQDFPGMDKVWARVEDKLEQKALQSKSQLWKKLAIAASLLLFVSLGYQFLKTDSKIVAPTETNETKVVIQKNETIKNSIVPSENIKTEATKILQKQLKQPNPVAIVENHAETTLSDTKIVSKAKAEETKSQPDALMIQEPNSTLAVAPMATAKAKSLAPIAYEYKEKAEITSIANSTEKTITGTITDEKDNLPIPGATVQIKGKNSGVVTDFDGKYTIGAEKGEKLIFNMIGYNSHEAIVGNSNKMNTKLSAANAALNEVVVVGYGTSLKKQAKNAEPIAKYGTTKFYKAEKEKTVPHIKDALYVINGENYEETSLFGLNPTSPYAPLDKQKIESVKILSIEEATNNLVGYRKDYSKVIIITTENGIPLKR